MTALRTLDDGVPLAIQPAEAPMLPVETHVIAIRAAEAARNKAEVILLLLQHAPRDTLR